MTSLMRLNDTTRAVETAQQMLRTQPYDAEIALALRSLKAALDEAFNPAALSLAVAEHAAITQALAAGCALKATHGEAVASVGDLYDSAMQLAYFYRYSGANPMAAATVADLDAALAKAPTLGAVDQQQIGAARSRYALLGQHLPAIEVQKSLQSPTAKTVIDPQTAAATVLVLFPDWCVQCRKMMKTLTAFAIANGDTPIHAYGLMYAENADDTQDGSPSTAGHEEIAKQLQGTATMVVPASTVKTFAANEFPLGILVDSAGTIRYLGTLSLDAFNGGGFIEKAIPARVIEAGEIPQIVERKK
jgi:thiol-disulfide isomerase/thioredoxin